MAIEAGGKSGIIVPDERTLEYVRQRAKRPYKVYASDADARYSYVHACDVSKLRPQVALPFLPSNVKPVDEVGNIPINAAVIGSCTNSRIGDLRLAARVLSGKKVHPDVRLVVTPGSWQVLQDARKEGIMEVMAEAGAFTSSPCCGHPCGGNALAEGERCISTTNRNFVGRMGHSSSEVYLANPAVVAASAVRGRIASPEEVDLK